MDNIDYGKVYAAFDGNMSDCDGACCSEPCCGTKQTLTWGQGPKSYNTTITRTELTFQEETYGPLGDLGIETETVDVNTDRGASNIRVLIRGCLGKQGECLLSHRKPAHCRLFPLSTNLWLPVRKVKCPKAEAIGRSPEVRAGIKKVREALEMTDHATWEANLDKELDR
jgi:hypothetical protein